ncbi:MAG: alpha/beta fold hydrolase [Prolixibacteraceae bacterium]|nr:alpha/beta fold hydrolase [Prolixibacteraceae bacterium]
MRYIGTDIETTINHLSVSYTDEGPDDAPVIILIHGFPFTKSMWNKQVEVLIERNRVIAYDIRGHGNSPAGTEDFTIELFVNDLIGLMDILKIETAMLCGLSLGGYIALNAMENYPKRFNALVLCDTTCAADTPEAVEKRMMTIKNIEKFGVETYANESLKNLFAPESFVTSKKRIGVIKDMILKTPVKMLTSTLHALASRKETCSTLQKIRVPVLILVGEEDKITPLNAAQQMQKNIAGSILHSIEHAGHLSNIENPYEFNAELVKFAASVNHQPGKNSKRDQLVSEVYNSRKITKYEKSEKELNAKILRITMVIKDHYPELSKYLDEMPVTIPSEKDPEVTLNLLKEYYESLHSILNKYKIEFPIIEE